jgi:flagellar biosynthetic protein FlhB
MADTPDSDQKTEEPSAKRLREAGERGDVLQSRELGTALVLVAATGWLVSMAPGLARACLAVMARGLTLEGTGAFDPLPRFVAMASPLVAPLLGFAAVAIAGLVAGPLLTSARFSAAALVPKPGRINPAAGLKRMFGLQAPIELAKALLKAGGLLGVGFVLLRGRVPDLIGLDALSPPAAAVALAGVIAALLTALTGILLLIAGIDLPVQWLRHRARLRMTKQEVKDEAKESDGSPETKGAIRRAQRAAAKGALRPAMAAATVVVVNPTAFAVALRYDPARDSAPVVVAKGRDIIAAAIRELAGEAKVPVLRYPQLTRAIYFTAAVGQPIRDDLYGAVAAVLAFVFSLDRAATAAQPEVEVPAAMRFDEFGKSASGAPA